MDRWKSRDGKSQRGEEKKKEDQKRESLRRKKMQVREKIEKSRFTVFLQWFVARSGGSKGRLAKAAGAEPCGQMRDEKLHAVAARSTCPSQNVQSTPTSDHFWKLWCRKSARRCGAKHIWKSKCTKHLSVGARLEVEMSKNVRSCGAKHISKSKCTKHTRFGARLEVEMSKNVRSCGAKHISKSKCTKHTRFGALFEVKMSKKCMPLLRKAHFEVKMYKAEGLGDFLDGGFAWPGQGIVHRVKMSKRWGFCSISTNDGRRGTFEEDLQRCIFRGRRSARDMFIRDVRRSGRWFPERGCAVWSIRSSVLGRWFCVTGAALRMTWHHFFILFRGKRSTLDRWSGKIAKRIGTTRPSALHATFHFWRKSRRIASFFMLSTWKMRKSRRIVSFLTLSSSKIKEVSQNCCVYDVVKFKSWGSLAE